MTTLGKILVFVNLVFSFLAFSWALSLYLNRIDYTDNPAAEGKPAGELLAREETLKQQDAAFRRMVASAHRAKADLVVVEEGSPPARLNGRPADRDWYEAQDDVIVVGSPAVKPARSLQEVELVKGMPKLNEANANRPVMKDAKDLSVQAQPLRPLEELRKEQTVVLAELVDQRKALLEKTQKDVELTELIIGREDGKKKGLRQRLAEEKVKLADVLAEHERVRPLLVNAAVESQLILLRQERLHQRIDELRPRAEAPK